MISQEVYRPDNWVIIKINDYDTYYYKVLAGWSGGYAYGDSWRMNSGIKVFEETEDYYLFQGFSGAVYECHKEGYGLRMNNSGVWNELKKNYGSIVELMPKDTDWGSLKW